MRKVILFSLFTICSCTQPNTKKLYSNWIGKEITIPAECDFINIITEGSNSSIKIINYIDSIGCVRCKSQLPLWNNFIKDLEAINAKEIIVLQFLHPKTINEANYLLSTTHYQYPLCIDTNDVFNKINHISADERFHCFLLDENNHVILIGNPVQNPKIRDLYIRTICERLGIKLDLNVVSKPQNQSKNLGTFNWQTPQTTTFTIHNTGNESMLIDTLYTSCECTTAEIDKRSIEPTDSAIVSVKFNAEKPEMFIREVYIDVQGKEQIVLSIEGEAVE